MKGKGTRIWHAPDRMGERRVAARFRSSGWRPPLTRSLAAGPAL